MTRYKARTKKLTQQEIDQIPDFIRNRLTEKQQLAWWNAQLLYDATQKQIRNLDTKYNMLVRSFEEKRRDIQYAKEAAESTFNKIIQEAERGEILAVKVGILP